MKTKMIVLPLAAAIFAGCSTYDKGPYLPEASKTPAYENIEPIVLLDPGVQHSVTVPSYLSRNTEDGRLEAIVSVRNRENRRIEIQVNCIFKDALGVSVDETPFQTLILTENATEQVKFTSANSNAKKYTFRIRQAR
jgi:uncharacterized protein YcfL